MRPTSPLSLLLFLQLTSAAPILLLPSDCSSYTTCHPRTRSSTPATRLRTPHFPPHQLRPWDSDDQPLLEEPISNAPITPPANISPSAALSANTPLSSSYLLSLTAPSSSALQNPPQKPHEPPTPTSSDPEEEDEDEDEEGDSGDEEEALPAKPTSALPLLRQLDAIRYWASLPSDPERQLPTDTIEDDEQAEQVISPGPISPITRGCDYLLGASTTFSQPMRMARDYSDLLVVGIVVLFLGFVVIVELAQKVVDLRQAIWPSSHRRGAIYLSDDESLAFVVKKPFFLQPPPPRRHKAAKQVYKDGDVGDVEDGFYYDNDAFEKV